MSWPTKRLEVKVEDTVMWKSFVDSNSAVCGPIYSKYRWQCFNSGRRYVCCASQWCFCSISILN